MRMNAVLSNPKHPEYGQFTVPLPIPHNQYDGIMEALNAMDMGDPLARDCQMDEILGEYPILKRLEGKPVNIDELDYLAKRLDSFCYAQEGAQFQGAAVSYDYSDMTDLINLTFSCQQVTVITDFSDLEQVGRDHYMVLNGGCASKEELDALDGYETALLLIDEGNGVITPYGVSLDVEHEQQDMCERVGGCFMDLMGGVYRINPLEPKCWDEGGDPEDTDAPEAFRKSTRLSQHISFLKDFFRAYKDFSDRHIDAIEIMVSRLYEKWGISDTTDFGRLKPEDYPILSDLYDLIEEEYQGYDADAHQLYTAELLQEILLGLHSMCKGAEAKFFNGHTNVTSSRFIVFGVKGLLQANRSVRGAMLFNILSFMSDRLLTIGNTTAVLDELYVWLSDNITVGTTIIEYIRNILKRVRKKESNLIMASQNLEDFDREGIRELTKPLFAIPPHQFIFNCGSIDKRFYMDLLQLEEAEYNLIRFPQRGVCLFKCGNERYLLEVHAPAYKEALYGSAGGR